MYSLNFVNRGYNEQKKMRSDIVEIEELYNELRDGNNFGGECVLKICLRGPVDTGEINVRIATSYFSSMRIEEDGMVFVDRLKIKDNTLYGLIKDEKSRSGFRVIYQIPTESIKSFYVGSNLEHGKYHRPVYFGINQS